MANPKTSKLGLMILLAVLLATPPIVFCGCGPSEVTLTVSSTPVDGGTISPGSGEYNRGSEVTLIATPSKYYRFNRWAGDLSETNDRITIKMNSDKAVIASFSKITYVLELNSNPSDV